MGLINFFKGKRSATQQEPAALSEMTIQGPRYLRPYLMAPDADMIGQFNIKHPEVEWVGQLVSATQNRRFAIRYYGALMNEEIIVSDKGIAQKVVAVDIQTQEEILLFDKTLHGWDGFMTGIYEEQRPLERPANKVYVSKNGTDNFKIVLIAYYDAGTMEELQGEATNEHTVEVNGTALALQDAFDDAFDALVVYAIDENGNRVEIINEELA